MNSRSSLRGKYLLFVFFFILSALGACSSGESYKKPEVELKKVRITQIYSEAVALEGILEIYNPNDLSSRFSGYRYQLDLEGQRLLTGTSSQSFEIQAQNTFSITIPAHIRFQDFLTLSKKELFNRDLIYRLSGTIFLDSWMGQLPLPFLFEGTINLSDYLREKTRELLQSF
jgi:LEA14-like dessication related protein